jgi:hypothetical protein
MSSSGGRIFSEPVGVASWIKIQSGGYVCPALDATIKWIKIVTGRQQSALGLQMGRFAELANPHQRLNS